MGFHSMKRKQLQALCKKHKIPANLSNLEMANRLTNFLQAENVSEIESMCEVVNKKGKKVRFSPEHELIEFTRSPEIMKRRSRRNSVSRRGSNWSIEIFESGAINKETVGRQGSTMQTGELKLTEAEVKRNKRGRMAVKCNDGQKIASAVDNCEDSQLEMEEGDVVRSGRMTRLRGKTEAEGVNNASKREIKCTKDDYKRDEKASDNVKKDEHQEIVEKHSRVTRSRAQKLTEAPAAEEKRGRKVVKSIGKVAAVRAETGDNRDSLSKRGDEGEGKSATGSDQRIAGEHVTVDPQLLLRRSKRKVSGVGESEMFMCDTRKHENGKVKGSTKTSKLLASGVPEVDTEISGEGYLGRRAVLKIGEPIQKMEPRRSNKRKTMIESDSLRGDTMRSSLLQSDIVPEVSEDEKMVIQPIEVTRRPRRKTLTLKLVSTNDTDSAVENLDAEKHISESCLGEKDNYAAVQKNTRLTRNTAKFKPPGFVDKIGGDSNIHQKNNVMKRKRGHVTGDTIINNNDIIYGEQLLKGSSSEKVVSPAAKSKFYDERNQPHRLDNPRMLDASSHHDSSGIGELLFLDVQLSVSKESESANNSCSKNIISDVDLTFIKETHKKKEEVSVADSADSSCMNLDNERKLVNSNTNAESTSKSADRGIESSASEDQICNSSTMEVEMGKLLLESDVQESVEQNITDVDRIEAQMYSQAEDSGSNNKINDQVLAEGLNVSGEEGSAETCSSADSFLLGDQTDVKTNLEVAETEVDERVQPCLRVADHHNDLDGLELGASSNILDINNEDTSRTPGAFESCGTDYIHSKSTSKLKAPSLGMTRHHGDNVAKVFDTFFHKGRASELAEADEDCCSKDQKNASDHFSESNRPDLCHSERKSGIVSPDRAEKQKRLLGKSNELAYSNQRQRTWSNASELAGNAVCFLKSSERKTRQHAEGLIADEDVNHENYGVDKEVSAEASISDVKSCSVSKIAAESLGDVKFQDTMETEHEHRNLVAKQTESNADEDATLAISRQSWTEAELQNLFGISDEDAPPRQSDTFCQGSEIANMTMSKNKSTASNSGILTKKQEKEMDGESGIESDADIYENVFESLFATPVKIMTPCKTEETSHDRVLDESVTSIQECLEAMKENVATGITSNEKAQNAGYEIENNFGTGAALSDNGGDDICEDVKEVESFELLNTSTGVLFGAEYDRCEALGDQLTHSKEECLRESNSVTEEGMEEHVIPLAESCLNDEETQKSIISVSGSPQDLYELQSCTHMSEPRSCKSKAHNKSEEEMTQSTISELSDANLRKSDVPENSHLPTACSNDGDNLRETSTETSSYPEVANIGSSEKGISPLLSLTASPDRKEPILESDDQYEAKKLNEKDGNPKSSQDISDELHTNGEVAIQENVSIGYNICRELEQLVSSDELENLCKEAKGMETTAHALNNTDAAIEHGSFACGAVSRGDKKLEAGEPVLCLDEEKVQDAGFELENSLCIGDILSDDGGEDTCGKMNDVETVKVTSTNALSKTEYDGCEASEEQLPENKGECQKGTSCIPEDNEEKVIALGESCLYNGETYSDNESTEEYFNILSGKPNDLDKIGGCQDMLIDSALSESVSCKSRVDDKSEQEIIQDGEVEGELSDADLQKSKNSQNVIDEGTYLLTQSKICGAKICDEIDTKAKSSQDMSNESHINSEVANLKSLSDSNDQSEDAGLACGLELESTFLETNETGTTQDCNKVVGPIDRGSSVCGAELYLHLRDENNDKENLDMGKPVFNLRGDNGKKNSERAEENFTAQMVQFPIHELQFEENVEDFKNDTRTISNLPVSGYDEILRESDVADTIKEYIYSESSLPVIFENSGTSLPSDMLADTDETVASEKTALPIYEKDIAVRLACLTPTTEISCHSKSKDEDNVPSVDCPNTATLSTRPAQVSGKAANSPERVDEEGNTVKLEARKKLEADEDGQITACSTMRKNARTILIHGTLGKHLAMADMKENVPNQKRLNIGDITAVRPAKRKPLQDLQWK